MRTVRCGNCGAQPKFLKREKLQLGQTGFFSGDWGNILAGALEVEIYCCPRCGKIEFYQPKEQLWEAEDNQEQLPPEGDQHIIGVSRDGVPQVRCRACGKTHDFDYPRCPYCENPNV